MGQPELRTRLFLHAAAWCQRALPGALLISRVQREECHLWALPPFSSSTSMSVKLKLSRAFNSPGRANLGRRLSLRWLCLDEMFHDRFRAKRRRYFFGSTGNGSCLRLFFGDQTCVVYAMASSQRWDLALTPSLQGEARSWPLRYWPPLLCRSAVLASACDFQSPRL